MEHAAPAPVTQSQDSEPKKRKGALTNEDVLMAHVAPNLNYMDLFSLVKTTKEMRSRLSHEHALTAVLLNADDKFGKNAKATIRNVLSLYEQGKIHKPSPMRLLRLANGKRCEFGPPCDTPDARKVVKTRPDWGLFCCWPHTVGGSAEISLSKKSLKTWGATISDPRTCQHSMSNKTFLWKKPMTAADGEKIGPITTATSPHDGSVPDAALVALGQKLDRAGRERMSAAAAIRDEKKRATKASRDQKVAAIDATVERLAGDVRGVVDCRALLERLDPLYLAPSKATPAKLRAIVDDVRDAYAAAESNLGDDFSFLDESDVCDRVLRAMLTLPHANFESDAPDGLAPSEFLKYASRRVLDLAGAGELREAILVRLVTQKSITIVRRMSRQLTTLRSSCRSQPALGYLRYAVGLVVAGPQGSYNHRQIAGAAWDEVSRGRSITISLLETLVPAARELYQKAIVAAEELGRRLEAARGLQAGTGETYLLEKYAVNDIYQKTLPGFGGESASSFDRLLEIYDGPRVHRASAASPLGFWDG